MTVNKYTYLLKKSYQRFLSKDEHANKLVLISIIKTGITTSDDGVSYNFGEQITNLNMFISDQFELIENAEITIYSPEIIGMLESGLSKSSPEIFMILVKNDIKNVLLQIR